jgi:Na+-transporting methylmalonyl-CoA/oxaloacetate decarboxylase gamma subunit
MFYKGLNEKLKPCLHGLLEAFVDEKTKWFRKEDNCKMSLTVETIASGIVGVFLVMILLQIMVSLGSALAKAVEKKAAATAAKKAERAAREARRAKRA